LLLFVKNLFAGYPASLHGFAASGQKLVLATPSYPTILVVTFIFCPGSGVALSLDYPIARLVSGDEVSLMQG
jgi:hypothetical protein